MSILYNTVVSNGQTFLVNSPNEGCFTTAYARTIDAVDAAAIL
jgi:hypothetical protein